MPGFFVRDADGRKKRDAVLSDFYFALPFKVELPITMLKCHNPETTTREPNVEMAPGTELAFGSNDRWNCWTDKELADSSSEHLEDQYKGSSESLSREELELIERCSKI